jgi:hypothetical protein
MRELTGPATPEKPTNHKVADQQSAHRLNAHRLNAHRQCAYQQSAHRQVYIICDRHDSHDHLSHQTLGHHCDPGPSLHDSVPSLRACWQMMWVEFARG